MSGAGIADTLIVQSFRTEAVPEWLQGCMASVRDWARQAGHDYQFVGDELLALVPKALQRRINGQLNLLTDLARLLLLRDHLASGYRRVDWIDADVLVLEPRAFTLPASGFFFCREQFLVRRNQRRIVFHRIANAVTGFCQGRSQLQEYIQLAEAWIQQAPILRHTSIGTELLTRWHRNSALPLLDGIVMASPQLLLALQRQDLATLMWYRRRMRASAVAMNMSLFFRHHTIEGLCLDDELFSTLCERLLLPDDRGRNCLISESVITGGLR